MILQIVYDILSNDIDVNNSVSGRIFPVINQRTDATPFMVFFPLFADYDLTIDLDLGIVEADVQIDIVATDVTQLEDIETKVMAAMHGKQYPQYDVQVTIKKSNRRRFENNLFIASADYTVFYKQ